MCKQFEKKWYTYLQGLKNNIPHKMNSYQAALVACKGTCPDGVEESIPYTYYSSGVKFEKSLTLIFKGWLFLLFVSTSLFLTILGSKYNYRLIG